MIRRVAIQAYEFTGFALLMAALIAWFVVLP